MAHFVCIYLLGFLLLTAEVVAVSKNDSVVVSNEMVMEEEELLGLYEVLEGLLDDPMWAQVHPQPCTDTPWLGVQCEVGEENTSIFHVTKIHIGPDIVNPPCKASATLSKSFPKLPYLKTLSIFNCFVSSPVTISPTLFGTSSSLEHLAFDFNPSLQGEIPPSLTNLSGLRVLTLSQNSLQGKIPDGLGGLINLVQLDLSYNNLSGKIPEDIGGLKRLSILDLSHNVLEGFVPSTLGQLQLLEKLDLGSNQLIGRLPPDLGKLNRLVLLDLSHNFIHGPMPPTLSGLEKLEYLILDQNPLKSRIPMYLQTLIRLTVISLSGCRLQGPIPKFLSSLKNLTALSLDHNSLTGTIPPGLGSLPNLGQLNLSHNQLSGQLLLPEAFIDRLGNRLDVRGNSGLCKSNKMFPKNDISVYLETPTCFNGEIEYGDNETCSHQNCPDESKQPSWYHDSKTSKASIFCLDHNVVICTFIAWFLSFIM